MHEKVKQLINRVYIKKDYNFFVEKSKNPINIPKELDDYIKNINFLTDDTNYPSKEFNIYFEKFEEKNFILRFQTILTISKIDNLYSLYHQFEIDNCHPNKIAPTLDGFSDQPYIKEQYEIENVICTILDSSLYQRLFYVDLIEVIKDLDMPKDIKIFGKQLTVETAIFRDVFNLIDKAFAQPLPR